MELNYPLAPQLIEHVEVYGHTRTYADYAAEYQMPKSAVAETLRSAGLAPGGTRSHRKPVTVTAFPWGDE